MSLRRPPAPAGPVFSLALAPENISYKDRTLKVRLSLELPRHGLLPAGSFAQRSIRAWETVPGIHDHILHEGRVG